MEGLTVTHSLAKLLKACRHPADKVSHEQREDSHCLGSLNSQTHCQREWNNARNILRKRNINKYILPNETELQIQEGKNSGLKLSGNSHAKTQFNHARE